MICSARVCVYVCVCMCLYVVCCAPVWVCMHACVTTYERQTWKHYPQFSSSEELVGGHSPMKVKINLLPTCALNRDMGMVLYIVGSQV